MPAAANDQSTAHPNILAMEAAITRWIEEASTKPGPAAALAGRIEWLERQSAILSGPGRTPAHLEGLSAFDMTIGIGRLAGAQNSFRAVAMGEAA